MRRTIETEVEVDVDLEEFPTEELVEELRFRNATPRLAEEDYLHGVYSCLLRGDANQALIYLERALYPSTAARIRNEQQFREALVLCK